MKHFLLCVWMMCTLAVGGSLQMTAQTTAYGCISSESNGCKMVSFDWESMSTESVTAVKQLFKLPSELEGVSCGVSVGKKYYAMNASAPAAELAELCAKIDEYKKQINEKELEIKKNRGERICCECGKTVTDKTAAFCPFCGTKMEEVCADADDKQQTDEECAAENETSATAEPAAENSSDKE